MEEDPEKLKAKGIYLGGIGLLIMGIAVLIWSATRVISVVYKTRMMKQYAYLNSTYSNSTEYSTPTDSRQSNSLPDIKTIVEELVQESKKGTQIFYRLNNSTNP